MKTNKQEVVEKLQNLISFIENMEAISKNPYSSGLKEEQLLADIKAYIYETIDIVDKIEEITTNNENEPEADLNEKVK